MSEARDTLRSRRNIDSEVVADFGREWNAFDQTGLPEAERRQGFDAYFAEFPWAELPDRAVGFDAGCGSGRWAVEVAKRVHHLHCVDPSDAIDVARRNLAHLRNCTFHRRSIDELPFDDDSMDFGYSLGVLHHLPDTQAGMTDCIRKLRSGAPFLVYLYYAFDNQPVWFRKLWRVTDYARGVISRLPHALKLGASQAIAATVYFPLARSANIVERLGGSVHSWPLSSYRRKTFYSMRTDALDRFGTRLERRFTKREIEAMMTQSGLRDIRFNPRGPFWCAVGIKR